MQGNMANALKTRASKQAYTSIAQLPLPGFETPFAQKLTPTNRWVILAGKIPWDGMVKIYTNQLHNSVTGAGNINPRIVLGAIIIKHMCDYSDEETILQIQENMYLQYFIGLSSYTSEKVFDPSLFVELRNRLNGDLLNQINELIAGLSPGGPIGREPEPEPIVEDADQRPEDKDDLQDNAKGGDEHRVPLPAPDQPETELPPPQGQMIIDATASPQDISYPTDVDLLNDAREKSEELIDRLYYPISGKAKPRTYRVEARKAYLEIAQKKTKTKKEIRRAIKKQLQYLRRNLAHIDNLLKWHECIPLDVHQYKYMLVIRIVYEQQNKMYQERIHQADHRIVSIHQPHVRPIVRGKTVAKVEFGAKINVSLVNGYAFLEDFSWEAYNEGVRLMDAVERYRKRFGYYPKELLADKIYCTRENRKQLKLLGITLKAKPLGRPKAVEAHVSPGERNPIEGKFGQAKRKYGMGRIKARLAKTSESWIASIIMVLNLVNLAGQVLFALLSTLIAYALTPIYEGSVRRKAPVGCALLFQ
jgi:transposase, IS5 family